MAKYKIFTKENASEAKKFIGKEVYCSDMNEFKYWKALLISIDTYYDAYPFFCKVDEENTRWKKIRVPVEEFQPEIFHAANVEEAKKFINREIEYYSNGEWRIGTLICTTKSDYRSHAPYMVMEDNSSWHAVIRTTPNSYSKKAEPKTETPCKISKETLLKSVAQWDLMSRGIEKGDAYAAIAWRQPCTKVHDCFLCVEVGQVFGITDRNLCKHCIKWNSAGGLCFSIKFPTPYTEWQSNPGAKTAKAVADFLFQKYQEMENGE